MLAVVLNIKSFLRRNCVIVKDKDWIFAKMKLKFTWNFSKQRRTRHPPLTFIGLLVFLCLSVFQMIIFLVWKIKYLKFYFWYFKFFILESDWISNWEQDGCKRARGGGGPKNTGSATPLRPSSRWASVAQWLTFFPPKSAVFAGVIPLLYLRICSLLRLYGQLTTMATWRIFKRTFLSVEITIQKKRMLPRQAGSIRHTEVHRQSNRHALLRHISFKRVYQTFQMRTNRWSHRWKTLVVTNLALILKK